MNRPSPKAGTAARTLALLVVAVVTVLMTPVAAQAHAALVSSNPRDGASLTDEPGSVSLTFDENIGTPAYVIVVAPNGTHAESGKSKVVDHTITQATKSLGIAGRYAMSYRAVSADDHPVEGTLHFTVQNGRVVKQRDNDPSGSFVHRHVGHITWGLAGVIAAGVILFLPWRKRDG